MRRVISIALLATIAVTTAHPIHAFANVNGDEKASFDDLTFTYPDFTKPLSQTDDGLVGPAHTVVADHV